jgi:hypothetical protein
MAYEPANPMYGSVYMEKARGRVLAVLSEMNTTRKGLNTFLSMGKGNESTLANAKALRGAAYKEALKQIMSMPTDTLGDYSVVSNAFRRSNYFTQRGGRRRRRKNGKKTRKH